MSDQGSILVVDDDLQVNEMLEELLIELGYSVDVATTGDEGFRRAATKRPDAVILDVSLPDTTGDQVLAKLRSHDESRSVIMVSGHTDEEIARRAVAGGAIGYLRKPFDFNVLCRTISEAVAAGRRAAAECATR